MSEASSVTALSLSFLPPRLFFPGTNYPNPLSSKCDPIASGSRQPETGDDGVEHHTVGGGRKRSRMRCDACCQGTGCREGFSKASRNRKWALAGKLQHGGGCTSNDGEVKWGFGGLRCLRAARNTEVGTGELTTSGTSMSNSCFSRRR